MIESLIILVSLLNCVSQICQKKAAQREGINKYFIPPAIWFIVAIGFLALSMLIWLFVLQNKDIGSAYPMLSLNFVFVTLAGHWIWKEPISKQHLIGMIYILIGLFLLGVAI